MKREGHEDSDRDRHRTGGCIPAHTTHNFIVARTSVLLLNPWVAELKMFEHEAFFFGALRRGLRVVQCDSAVDHNRPPSSSYTRESHRFRTNPSYGRIFCNAFPGVVSFNSGGGGGGGVNGGGSGDGVSGESGGGSGNGDGISGGGGDSGSSVHFPPPFPEAAEMRCRDKTYCAANVASILGVRCAAWGRFGAAYRQDCDPESGCDCAVLRDSTRTEAGWNTWVGACTSDPEGRDVGGVVEPVEVIEIIGKEDRGAGGAETAGKGLLESKRRCRLQCCCRLMAARAHGRREFE